jgi:CubicO group peptidase (beta-lactamase class C family)
MNKIFSLFSLLIMSSAFADFDAEDLKVLIAASEAKDSDALMVWKDGVLLYTKDNDETMKYSIQSVTKSLTALTTSCILRDTPEKLDQPLIFPEWAGTPKEAITLRMLLSMNSGIMDPANPWGDNDYYEHAASQPLTHPPGTVFEYANVSPMIVGKWIKESTGQQFTAHINRCFFSDMGITDWTIGHDGQGNDVVAGGVRIHAKDLLKVGVMLIQNGMYEGKELMNPAQVKALRVDSLADNNGYGLSFWLWGRDIYYAEGYLGQFLIMVPKENLVVLRIRNRENMGDTPNNNLNWFTELPGLIYTLIR